MAKKKDPHETVVKGLRLPAWLVDEVERTAQENHRGWSAQVTHDLASIPRYGRARPGKKKVKNS